MFAFSLLVTCLELYLLWDKKAAAYALFTFTTIGLFFFYSILQHVFELFASGKGPAVFSMLPSVLLFFLIRNAADSNEASIAVIVSAILRLIFIFLPNVEKVIDYAVFVITPLALYLYFSYNSFRENKLIGVLCFVCLTVLIMSVVQKLFIEKNKDVFPIYFFIIIGLFSAVIPVREEPINWTYVIEAGERFSENIAEKFDQVSYFFSDIFSTDSFSSGYSTLGKAGGKFASSKKTQLILRTAENPYFTFKDPVTNKNMIRRRTIYLAGGKLSDAEGLIRFAHFMRAHDADKQYVSLFARTARLSIEYGYLKTGDEIAPINSILLTNSRDKIISEKSMLPHKMGYTLNSTYLDIDYGSPYLIDLIKSPLKSAAENGEKPASKGLYYDNAMTYDECQEYLSNILGIDLSKIISPKEYDKLISTGEDAASKALAPYLDTTGAGSRMQILAKDLTSDALDTYDKCRLIENYLRQYSYSTVADDKNAGVFDLSTTKGMSQMADSFLFETGRGYCVHFASSMTMLLRLSGIPARIVTGYRYVFPFEKEESYKVSSTNAHAWPEAYIEGVGWIPFEPTTVYLTAGDRSWNKAPVEAQVTDYAPIYESVPHLPETIADTPKPVVERALNIAYVIIPVIASILLLLLILVFGSRAIDKFRYRHSTPRERIHMDVTKIKKSLRKLSAEGFIDRGLIYDYIPLAPSSIQDNLKKVFAIYYRLEYSPSDIAITPEESEFVKSVSEEVLRLSDRNS